jgi:hypothetical protein
MRLEKLVHHADGCNQMQRKKHFTLTRWDKQQLRRSGRLGNLVVGRDGIEWWNRREGTIVRILGPKPGCVTDWDLVTCANCLSKRAARLRRAREASNASAGKGS